MNKSGFLSSIPNEIPVFDNISELDIEFNIKHGVNTRAYTNNKESLINELKKVVDGIEGFSTCRLFINPVDNPDATGQFINFPVELWNKRNTVYIIENFSDLNWKQQRYLLTIYEETKSSILIGICSIPSRFPENVSVTNRTDAIAIAF